MDKHMKVGMQYTRRTCAGGPCNSMKLIRLLFGNFYVHKTGSCGRRWTKNDWGIHEN